MKKKNRGIIIFLITLTAVLSLGLIVTTCCLLNTMSDPEEQFVSMLGVAIGFVGTMVLGIIAYWQTRQANNISKLMIKKETEIHFNILPSVKLSCSQLNIDNILRFSEFSPTEGVFCTEEPYNYKEEKKYIEISIPFEIINGNLESIQVRELAFNKTLEGTSEFIGLTILNKGKFILSYNPQTKSYWLKLYIYCNFNKLLDINKNNMFVLDLDFSFFNNYEVEQTFKIQFNFYSIKNLKELIEGKIKKIPYNLENIIILKGE